MHSSSVNVNVTELIPFVFVAVVVPFLVRVDSFRSFQIMTACCVHVCLFPLKEMLTVNI